MVTDEEKKVAKLELFKLQLASFVQDNFSPCSSFTNSLKACKTEVDVKKLFVKHADDVYEQLGGDSDLQSEVDKLERDVDRLEDEISELEDRLEDALPIGNTLNDEFKRDFFAEYQDKYTPW